MKNQSKRIAPILVLLVCASLVFAAVSFNGCGTTKYEGKIASISVTPGSVKIGAAKTQQYTATGINSDPSMASVSNYGVTWASSDTSIATIDAASGLATAGTTTGTTTITATDAGGVQGRATLEVGTVKTAAPVSIVVSPAGPNAGKGKTKQFTATGTFDDGSTDDVSTLVTWASSNTAVATIDAVSGLATVSSTAAVGDTTTITATVTGTSITASTVLTVIKVGLY